MSGLGKGAGALEPIAEEVISLPFVQNPYTPLGKEENYPLGLPIFVP
jgi:hypothetical protein